METASLSSRLTSARSSPTKEFDSAAASSSFKSQHDEPSEFEVSSAQLYVIMSTTCSSDRVDIQENAGGVDSSIIILMLFNTDPFQLQVALQRAMSVSQPLPSSLRLPHKPTSMATSLLDITDLRKASPCPKSCLGPCLQDTAGPLSEPIAYTCGTSTPAANEAMAAIASWSKLQQEPMTLNGLAQLGCSREGYFDVLFAPGQLSLACVHSQPLCCRHCSVV